MKILRKRPLISCNCFLKWRDVTKTHRLHKDRPSLRDHHQGYFVTVTKFVCFSFNPVYVLDFLMFIFSNAWRLWSLMFSRHGCVYKSRGFLQKLCSCRRKTNWCVQLTQDDEEQHRSYWKQCHNQSDVCGVYCWCCPLLYSQHLRISKR